MLHLRTLHKRLMPRMSYEFSHKLFGTKQVPIESACNSEHFDMHLMAELFMVPEIHDGSIVPMALAFFN